MLLNNKLKGDAGEYYVAYLLAARGINPAILSKDSKGVDLLATDDGKNVISIQVKTSSGSNNSKQWDVGKHMPEVSDSFFFFFINLWEDLDKEIHYLIVPSEIVRNKVDWSKERHLFSLSENEYKEYLFNWNQLFRCFD